MGKLCYNDKLHMHCRRFVSKDLVQRPGWKFSTVKKVGTQVDHSCSALLHKTGSGRPATAPGCAVCRCKTIFPLVGASKQCHFRKAGILHFHFLGEYSNLDKVKTMGTRGKININ